MLDNSKLDRRYFYPKVLQAIATDDYIVYAYLNDGSIHLIDMKPFLKKDSVFEPLITLSTFKDKLTVINDTVAWDIVGNRDSSKCIDLDPFTIFNTPSVKDPLEIVDS